MTGTLINVAAVLLGASLGALLGARFPEKLKQTAMNAIGLMALLIGFQMALSTRNPLILLGSIVVGAVLGESARIEDGMTAAGEWAERAVGANRATAGGGNLEGGSLFTKGFVAASLVFCVGPMSILGAFQDGLTGIYDTLAVKSMLDGFTALALASSLGWGVIFSSLTVLVYQGALTLGAVWAKPLLSEPVVAEMSAAGGLLIVGIGFNLLGMAKVRVASMLPALVIAPALVVLVASR